MVAATLEGWLFLILQFISTGILVFFLWLLIAIVRSLKKVGAGLQTPEAPRPGPPQEEPSVAELRQQYSRSDAVRTYLFLDEAEVVRLHSQMSLPSRVTAVHTQAGTEKQTMDAGVGVGSSQVHSSSQVERSAQVSVSGEVKVEPAQKCKEVIKALIDQKSVYFGVDVYSTEFQSQQLDTLLSCFGTLKNMECPPPSDYEEKSVKRIKGEPRLLVEKKIQEFHKITEGKVQNYVLMRNKYGVSTSQSGEMVVLTRSPATDGIMLPEDKQLELEIVVPCNCMTNAGHAQLLPGSEVTVTVFGVAFRRQPGLRIAPIAVMP